MKILAIEKELPGVSWENTADLLRDEAKCVYELYLADTLREIYFNENKCAVLILETLDKESAKSMLDSLPLVRSGKIRFEIMELKPYTGFDRLINKVV